jgi:hypothetical protein
MATSSARRACARLVAPARRSPPISTTSWNANGASQTGHTTVTNDVYQNGHDVLAMMMLMMMLVGT